MTTEVNEPIGEPTPDPVGDPPEGSELTDDAIDELADDEVPADMRAVRRLRNEAKRLRHLLREEQANRASEQESNLAKLAAYEKREVERAAATVLVDPEDVLRYTDAETQAAFNDEFGAIVGDRVVEAAKKLASERPHLARRDVGPPPSSQPIEGLRPGASPAEKPKPTSWAAAIRGTGA